MRKVKIAQIGTSTYSHGNMVFSSLKKQSDIFEIAGYAFPENERVKYPERMADFEGYPELTVEQILSDPTIEAVTVETEEKYLTRYALMAAQHGKHIHMEKPGSQELRDFEALIATAKRNATVFHTGYMYRYNPCVMALMERIERGELGDIISVEAQMNCWHTKDLRQWLGGYPGGSLFFLGCHLIDLIYRIQGAPQRILPLSQPSGIDGLATEDFGMAALVYPTGVSFAKVSSNEVGGFSRRQLVVSGTKATVEIKPLETLGADGQTTVTTTYTKTADWADRGVTTECAPYDRYDAMMRAFAAMVRGEKQNPYTYDYELALYRTILQCCGIGAPSPR